MKHRLKKIIKTPTNLTLAQSIIERAKHVMLAQGFGSLSVYVEHLIRMDYQRELDTPTNGVKLTTPNLVDERAALVRTVALLTSQLGLGADAGSAAKSATLIPFDESTHRDRRNPALDKKRRTGP